MSVSTITVKDLKAVSIFVDLKVSDIVICLTEDKVLNKMQVSNVKNVYLLLERVYVKKTLVFSFFN